MAPPASIAAAFEGGDVALREPAAEGRLGPLPAALRGPSRTTRARRPVTHELASALGDEIVDRVGCRGRGERGDRDGRDRARRGAGSGATEGEGVESMGGRSDLGGAASEGGSARGGRGIMDQTRQPRARRGLRAPRPSRSSDPGAAGAAGRSTRGRAGRSRALATDPRLGRTRRKVHSRMPVFSCASPRPRRGSGAAHRSGRISSCTAPSTMERWK